MLLKEISTKKKTREVLRRVKESSVFKLSSEEICIYMVYRLIELVRNENVIGYDELVYRFCEVGPGNLRFDPLAVSIFVNSKSCKELFEQNANRRKDGYFCSDDQYLTNQLVNIKTKLAETIKGKTSSGNCLMLLKQNLKILFKESDYNASKVLINKNKVYLEFIVKSEKIKGNILFRFYNTNEWIYPDSWHIWDIFQRAHRKGCIPVLVAPRIHGSCFPLFKSIGVLARMTYGVFAEQSIDEIKTKVLNDAEKDLLFLRAKSLPRIYSLSQSAEMQCFDGVKQLITISIPKYINTFKIRFEKMEKKIIPYLKNELKHLLNCHTFVLEPSERLLRIKDILSLKLGHLNAIQDFVRRHEELISELKT